MVAGWGVGKAIRVTLADGRKLKGKIQTIDMEHFSLLANPQAAPFKIAFTDVQQVESGGMTSRTGWLILGGAVGGFIILVAILGSVMTGLVSDLPVLVTEAVSRGSPGSVGFRPAEALRSYASYLRLARLPPRVLAPCWFGTENLRRSS